MKHPTLKLGTAIILAIALCGGTVGERGLAEPAGPVMRAVIGSALVGPVAGRISDRGCDTLGIALGSGSAVAFGKVYGGFALSGFLAMGMACGATNGAVAHAVSWVAPDQAKGPVGAQATCDTLGRYSLLREKTLWRLKITTAITLYCLDLNARSHYPSPGDVKVVAEYVISGSRVVHAHIVVA